MPLAPQPRETQETSALVQRYGDSDTINKLSDRLSVVYPTLFPGSERLIPQEVLALAQASIVLNLNPFNKEIMYLKSENRSLGVFIGIHGYRRAARRYVLRLNPVGYVDVKFEHVAPEDTNIPDIQSVKFAIRAVVTDLPTNLSWVRARREALESGLTADEVNAVFGVRPPSTEYVGIVYQREIPTMEKARVNPFQQAQIRAERGALRARYGVDMPEGLGLAEGVEFVEGDEPLVIEPEAETEKPKESKALTREQAAVLDKAMGVEPHPRKEAK